MRLQEIVTFVPALLLTVLLTSAAPVTIEWWGPAFVATTATVLPGAVMRSANPVKTVAVVRRIAVGPAAATVCAIRGGL